MVGSGLCVSVVSSSLTFSQCGRGRLSLVISDTSPDPISELFAQVVWIFPKDVVILTGIKVEIILRALAAGVYDL